MPAQAAHPLACAHAIRAQMLRGSEDPNGLYAELAASIAEHIKKCCGHSAVKAFRLAHGWTVQAAVEQVHAMCARDNLGSRGLTERSWKEWEAGGRLRDDYRDLLCRLFRTGPVQLGFAADYTPVVQASEVDGSDDDHGREMRRRTFLAGTAALAVDSPNDVASLVRVLELPRRSGRVSPDTLADLTAIAAAYGRSYRSTPAIQLLAAAKAHLQLAWALRPDLQPHPTRIGLLTVIGQMAALSGTICLLDQNQPAIAESFIRLAWTAAKETGSNDLQAIALGGRSFATAYTTGDHQTGLELAEAAWTIADAGTNSETRGWIAAVASERAASLGEVGLCHRYLAAARQALVTPSTQEGPGLGIGAFDADKLDAYEGGDMLRLGRYREAETALDAALEHLAPSMQRHRCTALIDRAEARFAAGDVDAACEDATQALELAAQVQHAGNLKRLHSLARRARETGASAGRSLWIETLSVIPDPKGPSA